MRKVLLVCKSLLIANMDDASDSDVQVNQDIPYRPTY